MRIEIRNLTEFKARLTEALGKTTTDKALDAVVLEAIAIMKERTRKGIDVHDEPFKAYSATPLYVSLKHSPRPSGGELTPRAGGHADFWFSGKTGRQTRAPKKMGGKSMYFKGGYRQYRAGFNNTVSLEATGGMFRSIIFRREGKTRILYFANALENAKAVGHEFGTKSLPRREFWGIGEIPTERERVNRVWEANVGKL